MGLTSTSGDRDQAHSCAVCESREGKLYHAREMMLGTRIVFPYWECLQCGCLSLTRVPDDLDRYYPSSNYYSFQEPPLSTLRKMRAHISLSRVFFPLACSRRTDLQVIRRARLTKSMALLDVGCGSGTLIRDLRECGYQAVGIDPFIPEDIVDRFGVRVWRKALYDVDRSYDVILFRHSLEHMHLDALRLARSHIKDDGVCVVCLPIIGWAWHHYRTNWSQLDAPRHLFLHTQKSFEILADRSGFRVERVVFDSNDFQFWASEAYRQNICLKDATPPSKLGALRMRFRAMWLNWSGLGDAAQFYLRPVR